MRTITVNDTKTVNDYPYGFTLKTTQTYTIEFKAGKGFRGVTQTVNPKTGRLNQPKKGVYNDIMYIADTDGRMTFHSISFYELAKFNDVMQFISDNFSLFTKEQANYLYIKAISFLKLELYSLKVYCNVSTDKVYPLIDKAVKLAVSGAKDPSINLFGEIKLDHVAIEALKDPNYQPFKVTSYGI